MAPLSVYFNTGIWIVLSFISIGFLGCNLQHGANMKLADSLIPSPSAYLEDRELSNVQQKVTAASNRELSKGKVEPDYFQLYRNEVLAAMEGAYSTGFSQNFNAQFDENMQEPHATEIILNSEKSRSYLPGIIYLYDNDETDANKSKDLAAAGELNLAIEKQTLLPSKKIARLQLTNLQIKDLPSELPALFPSDPRVSISDIALKKEDKGGKEKINITFRVTNRPLKIRNERKKITINTVI